MPIQPSAAWLPVGLDLGCGDVLCVSRGPTMRTSGIVPATRVGSSQSVERVVPSAVLMWAFHQDSSEGVAEPRTTWAPSDWARLIATSRALYLGSWSCL